MQVNPQVFRLATGLDFGLSLLVSLASYDPGSSCWKTSQTSLLPEWEELVLLATLPKWGMTVSGFLYALPTLALRTDAKGGSAWPTATAHQQNTRYQQGGKALTVAVNWPTPQERDHRGADKPGQANYERKKASGYTLDLNTIAGGLLNPDWVEALQGFPQGWTDIAGPQVQDKRSTHGKRRAQRPAKITG